MGELLEKFVLDDALIKSRVLAAALFARILDEEFALPDAGCRKGVGFDDVRAGLKEAAVNIADFIRSGQRIDVAVVFEVLWRVLEPVAANLLLGDIVGPD